MSELFKVRCPSCEGWGDHGVEEESGCLYICYGCGGAGFLKVDAAGKAAMAWDAYKVLEERILADAAAAKRREDLGVPPGYSYYIDEYEGNVVLIPPGGGSRRAVPVDWSGDIPF